MQSANNICKNSQVKHKIGKKELSNTPGSSTKPENSEIEVSQSECTTTNSKPRNIHST